MNPSLTTTFAHADPTVSPLTVNELIDLLNLLVTTNLNGSYIPYILQSGTPSVDDQDKVWIQLDSGNRPIATKTFYQGKWRRVYNGMIGEIRGYSGNPNNDFEMGGTDPGAGKIEGNYDGWFLCNGKNGTPNLSDKFLIGGHMDDSSGHTGYSDGWQTFVDGENDLKTGGLNKQMIEAVHLPELDVTFTLKGKEAKESDAHTDVEALVDTHYANATNHTALHAIKPETLHYGASPNAEPPLPQKEFPVLPPFYALAWIIFRGYA